MVPLGARQTLVLILFVCMTVPVLAVFGYVAFGAHLRNPYEKIRETGYTLRAWWFKVLLAFIAVGFAASLFGLPYAAQARPNARDALQVKVEGFQWSWLIAPATLPANKLIEFNVTAADVNHGFGIYSPRGVLLGQVQAMPGYTNHLFFTFPHPGVYLVRCMEYCGIFHPQMWIRIRVT